MLCTVCWSGRPLPESPPPVGTATAYPLYAALRAATPRRNLRRVLASRRSCPRPSTSLNCASFAGLTGTPGHHLDTRQARLDGLSPRQAPSGDASGRQTPRNVFKSRQGKILRFVRNFPKSCENRIPLHRVWFRIPLYPRLLRDGGFGFCFGFWKMRPFVIYPKQP